MLVSFLSIINSIVSLITPGLWFNNYKIEIDKLKDYVIGKSLL